MKMEDMFSYYNTEQLRGIAILLIIINHLFLHVLKQDNPNNGITYFGQYGVALFLLLSGFGITISHMKKGFEKHWIIKKFFRLWIPYIIVTIAWFILDSKLLHINHSNLYYIITSFFIVTADNWKIIDFNMWFLLYIFSIYILFFILFSNQLFSNIKKVIFLLGSIIILSLVHDKILLHFFPTQTISEWLIRYAIFFPIGIVLAFNADKIRKFLSKHTGKLSIKSWIVPMFFLFISFYELLSDGQILFGVIFFLIIYFVICKLQIFSSFLYFLGTISFELYLLHGPLMYRYDVILHQSSLFITFPIYFLGVSLLAVGLHYMSNHLIFFINTLLEKFKFTIRVRNKFVNQQY